MAEVDAAPESGPTHYERRFVLPEDKKAAAPVDLVNAAGTEDGVVLSFYHTLMPAPDHPPGSPVECLLVARVFLGWPQFKRACNMFRSVLEDHEDSQAKEA